MKGSNRVLVDNIEKSELEKKRFNMAKSRKGSSGPGRESSDAATGKTGVAAHIAAVAAAAANTPPPSSLFGNPYTSLSSPQQLSFVDPNVAIMTNAAATIAAVAASAVQHMAREKASSVPSAHSGAHGMSHGALVAALQHDARKPPPSSSLHPHVAALLGGRHSLPYPSSTGSLHRALNPGESATLHPAITTASMNSGSNTLLPHMHTWSADQLGECRIDTLSTFCLCCSRIVCVVVLSNIYL